MVLISEIKLLDFFIHELKMPEIKAKQYVAEVKNLEEKLETKIETRIDNKFADKKDAIVAEIDLKIAALETRMEQGFSENLKWTVATIIAFSGIIIASMTILLKVFFHQ